MTQGEVAPHVYTTIGRKVLVSLVPVVCPPELTHLADAIVDHMALTLGASPPLLRKGFNAGLLAYDLGALPFHGKRAHQLAGDRAETYFASWEDGPTPIHRQFAQAINQLMGLSCYEQPEACERVGYHPVPWIEEVKVKRLTVYKDDVAKQAAQIIAPDPLRPGFDIDTVRATARPRRAKAGA